MNDEELVKGLSKLLVERRGNNLTPIEKELLKQAIDQSRTWQELMVALLMASLR